MANELIRVAASDVVQRTDLKEVGSEIAPADQTAGPERVFVWSASDRTLSICEPSGQLT